MTDRQLLDAWYQHAAGAAGFIGGALKTQRGKGFLFQAQQRSMLAILDGEYDQLWLQLQAMPLPRPDQFETDLAQIVAKVQSDVGIIAAVVDLKCLGELIHAGLE